MLATTILSTAICLALSLAACQGMTAASTQRSPQQASAAPSAQASSYIVQAASVDAARAAVNAAGGTVTHELGIIDAVSAELTTQQIQALKTISGVQAFADVPVKTMGGIDANHIPLIGVDSLHAQGINGTSVTVAVLDSGTWNSIALVKNPAGTSRLLAEWDAITSSSISIPTSEYLPLDPVGHGTHVASIIASSDLSDSGKVDGIAPYAKLVSVRAFNGAGQGTYTSVINGLNWILNNRSTYNIRVLNLSFGATAQSSYWNDPLNKAVMKLWQAGVVVVASAGNWGPYAQSITVPGNVPYVITVGAMTDNYTPTNPADDRLASFSSTGPTYEGFVKPDVVAPGGHVVGVMEEDMVIPKAHPNFMTSGHDEYIMSGTSQAAAVVSGVVALMLQAQPSLTPNQVKCKLMSSALAAVDSSGKLAYSVFQQGAGMINAYAAVYNPYTSCGNAGLDIAADLAGTKHFGGPAHQKADGTYYVVDVAGKQISQQGFIWNNGYLWNQGYLWTNGYVWSQGYIWNQGYVWNNGYIWNSGTLWNQSFVPSTASYSSINHWVGQE
jgi:serine protease AprX